MLRAYGKPIILGMLVSLKANRSQHGKIVRIYPFMDKPNILVRWNHGAMKSYDLRELYV